MYYGLGMRELSYYQRIIGMRKVGGGNALEIQEDGVRRR